MATPPTLVAQVNSGVTTVVTTSTLPSLTWLAGDDIYVFGVTEDNAKTISTPTVSGLTFSALTGFPTNTGSNCKVYGWKATAASGGSGSITATLSTNTHAMLQGYQYRGSDGTGNTATAVTDTTDPYTANLTRAAANSAVCGVAGDWNAVGDTTITTSPAGGTVDAALADARLGGFAFHWGDQGSAGTTNYGFTGLSGGQMAIGVVEVKGTAGGGGGSTAFRRSLNALGTRVGSRQVA